MKKENVKVLIGSKKEAKAVRRVLKALGEPIEIIGNKDQLNGVEFIWFRAGFWFLAYNPNEGQAAECTTITLKQLVQLLAGEEEKRTPILTSEDGVPLYEGDKCYVVSFLAKGEWWYNISQKLYRHHQVVVEPSTNKAFGSKEAAYSWIAEQNKPRYISIQSDMYKLKIWSIDGTLFIESKDFSQRFMTSDLQEWIETCNKTAP